MRIKVALDVGSNSVMVADPDGRIIYCNAAVMAMMRNAEADLRKALPSFRADAILGSSFDIYHKNPSHQRNMLAALRDTHRATIRIGPKSFDLIVTPLGSMFGISGYVVEWADANARLENVDFGEQMRAISRTSFDERNLIYLKNIDKRIQLSLLSEYEINLEHAIESMGFTPQYYSCLHTLLNEDLVGLIKKLGMEILCWTVNSTEDIQRMKHLGVDGIISGYPDRVINILAED